MSWRNLDVLLAVAVDAEANHGRRGLAVRLDVDVRGSLVVGIDDDLVGELHDARVGLVYLGAVGALPLLRIVVLARAELHDDPAEIGLLGDTRDEAIARVDVVCDVVAQAHEEVAPAGRGSWP